MAENHSSKALQFWLGLAISGGVVFWLLFSVDWQEVAHKFVEMRWWMILPSIALFVLHFAFRSMSWRLLLGDEEGKTGFWLRFDSIMVGNLATFILPFRIGEFVRPYMLSRCSEKSFATSFASVVLERFFDLSSVLLAFGILLLSLGSWDEIDPFVFKGAAALSCLAVAIFCFILAAVYLPKLLLSLANWFLGFFPESIRAPLANFLADFLEAAEVLKKGSLLVKILFFTVLVWMSCFIRFWVMLIAFPGLDATMLLSVGTAVLVSLAIAAPSAPGFLGVYEAGCIGAFALFGLGAEAATAYAIITHVLEYVLVGVSGTLALSRNDLQLADLTKRSSTVQENIASAPNGS